MKTTASNGHNDVLANSSTKSLNKFAILQLQLLNKNTLHYSSDIEAEGDYDFENDEIYVDWEAISNRNTFL